MKEIATASKQRSSLDPRQFKAGELVKTGRIERRQNGWVVPSQTHPTGSYFVEIDMGHGVPAWTCTCPDWEEHGLGHACKHVRSVIILRTMSAPEIANIDTTQPQQRKTYGQNWPAYRKAQYAESEQFQLLVRDLARGVVPPEQMAGRPRAEIADVIFAMTLKVYRRSAAAPLTSDLKLCQERGYMRKAPHSNTLLDYMGCAWMTPILRGLVEMSALPLRVIETDYAIDSTEMSTLTYAPGYRAQKYGEGRRVRKYHPIAVHGCVGVRTHTITAIEVAHGSPVDSPEFIGLVDRTKANGWTMKKVSADKAYSGWANLQRLADDEIKGFIPFRRGTGEGVGAPLIWTTAYDMYRYRRAEFLRSDNYGSRQAVESLWSAWKRRFGDRVRSRTPEAQINEVLLMALCSNVVQLIHSMEKFGVGADFWGSVTMEGDGSK